MKRGVGEVKSDALGQLKRQHFCNLVNPLRRLAQLLAFTDFEKNRTIPKFDIHSQEVRSPGIGSNHGSRFPLLYLPAPTSLSGGRSGSSSHFVSVIAFDELRDQALSFYC
jgi:hypothetical protein